MTHFWEFARDHYFLVVFSFLVVCQVFSVLVQATINLFNRCIRHMNIRKCGWPPVHCDADGDFKPEPEKEDEP
jgi:hypothetical protein